jgi:hypothetical protein
MWRTENIPLNEKTYIWIKNKVDKTKSGQIVIEIKDNKVISIHYLSSEYLVDVDRKGEK